MSTPVELGPSELMRRALKPAVIVIGIGLWSVPMLVDAIRTGATSVTITGGNLGVTDVLTFVGIALTIVGGIWYVSGNPSDAVTERVSHDSSIRLRGKGTRARVGEIHSKTKLFGPWIEVYATMDVLQPPYTVKTTVVVNRSNLRSFRSGETVAIRIDPDDRAEIALQST